MRFQDIPDHLLDDIYDRVDILNKYNKKEILYKKRYDMVVKELTREYNLRGRQAGSCEGGECRGNFAFYIFKYHLRNKRYLKRYRSEIWKRKDYVNEELRVKFNMKPDDRFVFNDFALCKGKFVFYRDYHRFFYRTLKRDDNNYQFGCRYFKLINV